MKKSNSNLLASSIHGGGEKKVGIRDRAWAARSRLDNLVTKSSNNNNNNDDDDDNDDNAIRPKLWSRFLFFSPASFFSFLPRIRPTPGRIRDARQSVAGPGSFRIRDTRYWATPGQIGWDALQQFFYSAQRAKRCARSRLLGRVEEGWRGGLGDAIGRRFLGFIRMESALPLISLSALLFISFFVFSDFPPPKQARFPLHESFSYTFEIILDYFFYSNFF